MIKWVSYPEARGEKGESNLDIAKLQLVLTFHEFLILMKINCQGFIFRESARMVAIIPDQNTSLGN